MPAASLANLLAQSGLTATLSNGFPAGVDPLAGGRATRHAALPLRQPQPSRTRLHELHPSLHCSVIGTCFGLRELRNLVAKFADSSMAQSGDHTIHTEAVRMASRRDGLGKVLDKALERKFKATIAKFAVATDPAGIRRLWLDALERGDIPDACWALLRHPAATPDLVREAFSDVHMLSHLVGAANRADIRRLQELEREKAALEDKLARQQRHLTETLGTKERLIRELQCLLAARDTDTAPELAHADLAEGLRRETARRMKLERHVEALEARLATRIAEPAEPAEAASPPPAEVSCCDHAAKPAQLALDGSTILLVGGRPAQAPALARAVAAAGGTLLHHDGGMEMSLGLLPGLVSRADRVFVALDSVSHAAAGAARRLTRGSGKSLVALPSLSLTSLARAVGADA